MRPVLFLVHRNSYTSSQKLRIPLRNVHTVAVVFHSAVGKTKFAHIQFPFRASGRSFPVAFVDVKEAEKVLFFSVALSTITISVVCSQRDISRV